MHFSISDVQEEKHRHGNGFLVYHISANGLSHCKLRYKQLNHLHTQLKKMNGSSMPMFPCKKLLSLTTQQAEERRILLEKYIQTVSQDSWLCNNDLFNGYLLMAQQESFGDKVIEVSVDIYIMNGQKVVVECWSNEKSTDVLRKVCQQLNLPSQYYEYFALYFMAKDSEGSVILTRKLLDFESPYISQNSLQQPHKIVLRRSYWDSKYDDLMFENSIALNLVYTQTVADVKNNWILAGQKAQETLAALFEEDEKIGYLQLARKLKYYGYTQFKPCLSDYPKPGTKVLIAMGCNEISFCIEEDGECKEGSFKVTRMKCWRITVVHDVSGIDSANDHDDSDPLLELAIEYLMDKDKLEWITIISDQAILMSVCLQGMVEELLKKRSGDKIRMPLSSNLPNWTYMRMDGTVQSSSTRLTTMSSDYSSGSSNNSDDITKDQTSSVRKLTSRLSSISLKSSKSTTDNPLVENDAFEGIHDDDL